MESWQSQIPPWEYVPLIVQTVSLTYDPSYIRYLNITTIICRKCAWVYRVGGKSKILNYCLFKRGQGFINLVWLMSMAILNLRLRINNGLGRQLEMHINNFYMQATWLSLHFDPFNPAVVMENAVKFHMRWVSLKWSHLFQSLMCMDWGQRRRRQLAASAGIEWWLRGWRLHGSDGWSFLWCNPGLESGIMASVTWAQDTQDSTERGDPGMAEQGQG